MLTDKQISELEKYFTFYLKKNEIFIDASEVVSEGYLRTIENAQYESIENVKKYGHEYIYHAVSESKRSQNIEKYNAKIPVAKHSEKTCPKCLEIKRIEEFYVRWNEKIQSQSVSTLCKLCSRKNPDAERIKKVDEGAKPSINIKKGSRWIQAIHYDKKPKIISDRINPIAFMHAFELIEKFCKKAPVETEAVKSDI